MARLTATFECRAKRFAKVFIVFYYISYKLGMNRMSDYFFNCAFEVKVS